MRIDRPLLAGLLVLAGALAPWHAVAQECVPQEVHDPPRFPATRGATLTMAPDTYRVGGRQFVTNVYNRNFLGPTLTMEAGERVVLSVVNAMRETSSQPAATTAWTNLHYHGLVVTPSPDSADNVTHVHIDRDAPPRPYHFPVPDYHTRGMFWYHPHPHGISTSQVAGGLSGALLVGSILRYFPEYERMRPRLRERVLLIRDMSFDFMTSPRLLNVNGSTCAALRIAPGERQLWHIGNFGSNHFVNLKLQGMRWTLLAMDGNPLRSATAVDSLWLPPGSRAEVIVIGPPAGTRARLYSAPFFPIGPQQDSLPVVLGYLVSSGLARPQPPLRAPAGADASVVDTVHFLRQAEDVGRHTFRFHFPSQTTAAVNDTVYGPKDPPVNVPWGQVQEWTIINGSPALHTFHIHQTDFLVVSVNGREVPFESLRDNVPIGVHRDGTGRTVGDTVVVRFVFEKIAAGPFVFHCHVLQHEDEGMMHNVCVYDPKDPDGPNKCNAMFSGGSAHGH